MKLKQLLEITFAPRYIVKDIDKDIIVWEGGKYDAGYDVCRRVYDDYEVEQIRMVRHQTLLISISKNELFL